jgi:hypothetical protein
MHACITRRTPSTVIYIARITAIEVPCAIARRRKGTIIPPRRASSFLHIAFASTSPGGMPSPRSRLSYWTPPRG